MNTSHVCAFLGTPDVFTMKTSIKAFNKYFEVSFT